MSLSLSLSTLVQTSGNMVTGSPRTLAGASALTLTSLRVLDCFHAVINLASSRLCESPPSPGRERTSTPKSSADAYTDRLMDVMSPGRFSRTDFQGEAADFCASVKVNVPIKSAMVEYKEDFDEHGNEATERWREQ